MDPQPTFTFQDLFTHLIGDMAKAISERSDETQDQQLVRSQAAAHMILGFVPRDLVETMLAGHCVMLHEVLTANVRSALRGDAEPGRRGAHGSVVSVNKAFNDTLDRLDRYQQRSAESARDASDAPPGATTDKGAHAPLPSTDAVVPQPGPVTQTPNRAARRHAARAESRAAAAASRSAPKQAAVNPHSAVQMRPQVSPQSAEAIAACRANPDAMAALTSGDPAGFARAMGIAHPSEAFLVAAAAEGSPFIPTAPLRSPSDTGRPDRDPAPATSEPVHIVRPIPGFPR